MKRTGKGDASEHPLFRAMVVMGGSLAVGCGGATGDSRKVTIDESPPGTGGAGPATPVDGGDTPRSSGMRSSGGSAGTNTVGSGGYFSLQPVGSGGARAPNSGGASPGGSAGQPSSLSDHCPPTQWNCDADKLTCGGAASGWTMPDTCPCDFARPHAAEDCPPGEVFVCRQATSDASGQALPPALFAFGCSCVPPASDCSSTCLAALAGGADGYHCTDPTEPSGSLLCGCGWVFLR